MHPGITVTGRRVLDLLDALGSLGVSASVDGGWGVDALLERQTRSHEDLDLVVDIAHAERIEGALRPIGFTIAEDHLPVRFVMRVPGGEQVDFHTVTFDEEGGGVQPQPGGGSFRYPPEGFVRGRIAGRSVSCISAEVQILCHLGYEPTSRDAGDVLLLCRRFDISVPPSYQRFLPEGATCYGGAAVKPADE
jgi:lincosamide nucleotidyltransferase A/C/D/E